MPTPLGRSPIPFAQFCRDYGQEVFDPTLAPPFAAPHSTGTQPRL
ncbi:MAG TPA: hypothetical protein VFH51_08190 [Myxococcota bacterium]|nr:hypothetical protein [Myxococcota bacterium]